MLETLKPYARAMKWSYRFRRARHRVDAAASNAAWPLDPPPVFVVGCGRSGTTILGKLLQDHPGVRYFFEPYDLWAAIDPTNDALHLFTDGEAELFRGGDAADHAVRRRFAAAFADAADDGGDGRLTIEKTPYNALRLDYLDALAPGCRFVNVLRDPASVARSIARLAEHNTYRIAGKPRLNQWWGVDGVKWRVLAEQGKARGWFPDEVDTLTTEAQRGAYEWLVSIEEVERRRPALGGRLHDVRLAKLIRDPRGTLTTLCGFLGVEPGEPWLGAAAARVHGPGEAAQTVDLPPKMAQATGRWRDRLGL